VKHSDLNNTVNELIREYGITTLLNAIIEACDSSADFAHSCNDRTTENYWRKAAIAILDILPKIPEKTNKA
jgi:hypothetical protein